MTVKERELKANAEMSTEECELEVANQAFQPEEHPVVFYDGVCGLCDSTVRWLIDHDPKRVLRFSPLQGETAARLLPREDSQQLQSVVIIDGNGIHRRSKAAVRILQHLGGRYRFAGRLLWCIPAPIREVGYHIVSKVRYLLFGKKDLCRLPKEGENERFLP